MTTTTLPPRAEMLAAFLRADKSYDGVFLAGVSSTGIFCRPSCSARKPLVEHLHFFADRDEALAAGYRPCLRCRPDEHAGTPPEWIAPLLAALDRDPQRRWTSADLVALGLDPVRVRRWFTARHGRTFVAWQRRRRLAAALDATARGDGLLSTGLSHGWESASGFAAAVQRFAGTSPRRAAGAPVALVERLDTPLGPMLAAATDAGLCLLEFADRDTLEPQLAALVRRTGALLAPGRNAHLAQLADELPTYFERRLQRFAVSLALAGTPFQEQVWRALLAIPHGETRSYAALAASLGRPTAQRAVATANASNRIAILVPCHRVVAADGTLSGYGGGPWRKRRLLELEGVEVRA